VRARSRRQRDGTAWTGRTKPAKTTSDVARRSAPSSVESLPR
jgi:hypothetical protein